MSRGIFKTLIAVICLPCVALLNAEVVSRISSETPGIDYYELESNHGITAVQRIFNGTVSDISEKKDRWTFMFTGEVRLVITQNQLAHHVNKQNNLNLVFIVKALPVIVSKWNEEDFKSWPFGDSEYSATFLKFKNIKNSENVQLIAHLPALTFATTGDLISISVKQLALNK